MTDTAFCVTEAAILAACVLWACSLVFIRNKCGWPLQTGAKKQVILLRLAAVLALTFAFQTSLSWSVVPAIALCIMLLSLNSIVLSFVLSLYPFKK